MSAGIEKLSSRCLKVGAGFLTVGVGDHRQTHGEGLNEPRGNGLELEASI